MVGSVKMWEVVLWIKIINKQEIYRWVPVDSLLPHALDLCTPVSISTGVNYQPTGAFQSC